MKKSIIKNIIEENIKILNEKYSKNIKECFLTKVGFEKLLEDCTAKFPELEINEEYARKTIRKLAHLINGLNRAYLKRTATKSRSNEEYIASARIDYADTLKKILDLNTWDAEQTINIVEQELKLMAQVNHIFSKKDSSPQFINMIKNEELREDARMNIYQFGKPFPQFAFVKKRAQLKKLKLNVKDL